MHGCHYEQIMYLCEQICTQGISVYELIISCMNYWLGYVHECHCGQTINPNKLNKFLYRGQFRTDYLTILRLFGCFYFCEIIFLGIRRSPIIYKPLQYLKELYCSNNKYLLSLSGTDQVYVHVFKQNLY